MAGSALPPLESNANQVGADACIRAATFLIYVILSKTKDGKRADLSPVVLSVSEESVLSNSGRNGFSRSLRSLRMTQGVGSTVCHCEEALADVAIRNTLLWGYGFSRPVCGLVSE